MIRTRCAALCLAALLTLSTHPGEPETSGMPAQVEQKLREMGRVIDPAATARLYGPLHEKEPYAGVKIARDIRYGTDERQALDVFMPDQAGGGPRQVLMFVHGGAFVAGNKKGPPGSFYFDNVGIFSVRRSGPGLKGAIPRATRLTTATTPRSTPSGRPSRIS